MLGIALKILQSAIWALEGRIRSARYPNALRETASQLRDGYLHEADFQLFRRLNHVEGLVFDIGANRGHSAASIFNANQSLKVLSVEPNQHLNPPLSYLKRRFPDRFDYRINALGETSTTLKLRIPQPNGIDLSPSGSLAPSEFDKDYVQARLADEASANQGCYSYYEIEVEQICGDTLDLSPLLIKIDVEGWETQVLKGLEHTITTHYPVLMMEVNNPDRFMPILEQWGYFAAAYDPQIDRLKLID